MITIIATIRIKDGMAAEFEGPALELVAAVNANEPGNTLYALHRSDEPNTYIFVERYVDEAAIDAHRQSDHFKEIGARMGPAMAGRPEVQVLNQLS